MPHTSILVVNFDQSSKNEDGVMASAPQLYLLLKLKKKQLDYLKWHILIYIRLWVEKTVWLNGLRSLSMQIDYVHFNYSGAKYASTLIFEFLMNAYQEYKKSLNE